MDLLDLFVKIGVKDEASGSVSSISDKLKTGLATAGKVAAAGVTAAATAVGVLTTSSLNAYSSYEQLTGGVKTLFDTSASKVIEYADNAYKTAGLSANEYMETVTSFSASLLQGLNGDTEKAAEVANQAITDMSDNANKMGTSMESIQYAYQGFAKQNYTMLDNLKLGYGGTQAEMARLINESGVLGDTMTVTADTVNQVSFDKIIEAIHVVQDNLGITGTTAMEAATTIEGSVNSAKSAWQNLVTGLADDNADLDTLVNNFVESVSVAASNIIPRIETILSGVGELIQKLAPVIAESIPGVVEGVLPPLIEAAGTVITSIAEVLPDLISVIIPTIIQFFTENIGEFIELGIQIVTALVTGISDNIQLIIDAIPVIVEAVSSALSSHGSELMESGGKILSEIVNGIISKIPEIASNLPKVITAIVEFISENLPKILEKGTEILNSLVDGIMEAIPNLVSQLPEVISAFVDFVTSNLPTIVGSGIDILLNLIEGILKTIPELVGALPQIIDAIVNGIGDLLGSVVDVGKRIVEGIWQGISSMASWIGDKIGGFFGGIVDGAKSFLGIASPSKVFASIGGYMAEGLGEGWNSEFERVKGYINNSFDFEAVPASKYQNYKLPRNVYGSGININISNMSVRSDNDIDMISRKLYSMLQRSSRGKGVVVL